MHIEQDVVNFEMSDADAKSGPVKGTDIAVDIAKGLKLRSLNKGIPSSHLEKDKRLILGYICIYS